MTKEFTQLLQASGSHDSRILTVLHLSQREGTSQSTVKVLGLLQKTPRRLIDKTISSNKSQILISLIRQLFHNHLLCAKPLLGARVTWGSLLRCLKCTRACYCGADMLVGEANSPPKTHAVMGSRSVTTARMKISREMQWSNGGSLEKPFLGVGVTSGQHPEG